MRDAAGRSWLRVGGRAAQAREAGEALQQLLAIGDGWRPLFRGGSLSRREVQAGLGSAHLQTLERSGLLDVGHEVTSPFAAYRVERLLVFTDPPVPAEARAATRLDPLREGAALARLLERKRSSRGLDMGTGCGVLPLAMSRLTARVVGVGLTPRAVPVAAFNAVRQVAYVAGDFVHAFDRRSGPSFDHVAFDSATNREGTQSRSLLDGRQAILPRCLHARPAHLCRGGVCQVNLAVRDRPGDRVADRLRSWLDREAASFQMVLLTRELESTPDGGPGGERG
jgi:hypothetical protein